MSQVGWERHARARQLGVEEARRWLGDDRVEAVEALGGGLSNSVFRVDGPWGARALKVWDRDPDSAGVERAALRRVSGLVPVPEVLDAGDAPVPWALLSWCAGEALAEVFARDPQDARALGVQAGRVLRRIHTVEFDAFGFFDAGLEVARPLPSLSAGYDRAFREAMARRAGSRLGALAESVSRTWEAQREDAGWGPPVLCHGDYKPENLWVAQVAGEWAITGVLDWEWAFAGSRLGCLGQLLRWADRTPGFEAGVAEGYAGGLAPGWRRRAAWLDALNLVQFLDGEGEHPTRWASARERLARWVEAPCEDPC